MGARLLEPRRALVVGFRSAATTGRSRALPYLQHTLTMGPMKGGVRYSLGVSLGECAALAMWMTFNAAAGAAVARREGGVRCDPYRLSWTSWSASPPLCVRDLP